MKALPLILLLFTAAGCAEIPELEGSESSALRKAPYPKLIPLEATLDPPADPVSEAAEVEEYLSTRSDALVKRAEALLNAEIK